MTVDGKKKQGQAPIQRAGANRELKDALAENKKEQRDNSSPIPAPARALHPEGLTPFPFQLFAVDWALIEMPTYLALDPGLGKTIVAAMIANALDAFAFYVCPPFLETNTKEEFKKWRRYSKLYVLPDSMIHKPETIRKLQDFIGLLPKHTKTVLFIDEAHRFKNEMALRTKALFGNKRTGHPGIFPLFDNVVFLSGTPIPNSRPKELWPILKNAAPHVFGDNFFKFGTKYCAGYKTEFGWDFSGFSNKKEFKARLFRNFMLRLKKDVLNLPPKLEGLLTVGDGIPPVISKVEKKILEHYSPEDLIEGKIAAAEGAVSLHLATYLKLLGEYKLKYALPYIESILNETEESIILFAHHKEVVATLAKKLAKWKPLVITGDVHKSKRQGLVKTFQESPEHRVFLGNIQACGVGFTLTKATRVLFIEFSWVDGENSQAADRAHRIGQNQTVQVQYVVLKDSFDRKRMELLLNKRRLAI